MGFSGGKCAVYGFGVAPLSVVLHMGLGVVPHHSGSNADTKPVNHVGSEAVGVPEAVTGQFLVFFVGLCLHVVPHITIDEELFYPSANLIGGAEAR